MLRPVSFPDDQSGLVCIAIHIVTVLFVLHWQGWKNEGRRRFFFLYLFIGVLV
jgi:hypothetical protein